MTIDRREFSMAGLAAMFGGQSVKVPSLKAIAPSKPDGKPLFVLKFSDDYQPLAPEDMARIREQWNKMFAGQPPGELFVAGPGVTLEQVGAGQVRFRERYEEREVEYVGRSVEEIKELILMVRAVNG